MAKPLLDLCSVPPIVARDGVTGPFARVLVPFLGHWYPSGQTYTFPGSTIKQPVGNVMGGNQMVNTYQKDCCGGC